MSLVGVHTLYHWSILENHISLLPSFLERSLSYAQTHFWYVFKLVYPRYLCFDYGFACMPTVHVWRDPRNVLPLLMYGLVLGLGVSSVQVHILSHTEMNCLVLFFSSAYRYITSVTSSHFVISHYHMTLFVISHHRLLVVCSVCE